MSSYLNAKGISLGVSVLTAGTLHFLDSVKIVSSIGETAKLIQHNAVDKVAFVTKTAMIQSVTYGVSQILYNSLKNNIDENDINTEASNIAESIVKDYQASLVKIYASDEASGKKELQFMLARKLETIVFNIHRKFHDTQTELITGTASGVFGFASGGFDAFGGLVGIGSAVNTAMKTTLGFIKNQEAFTKMNQRTRAAIEEVASLASNVDLTKVSEASTTRYINIFKNTFTSMSSRTVTQIQQREILKPVTDMVSGEIGNKWGHELADFVIEKIEESKKQKEAKPKPDNDNEKSNHKIDNSKKKQEKSNDNQKSTKKQGKSVKEPDSQKLNKEESVDKPVIAKDAIAKIEVYTRDLKVPDELKQAYKKAFNCEECLPQHSFIIYTESNGKQTIIRGGPKVEGTWGMLTSDLNVVIAPYEKINKDQFPDDFFNKGDLKNLASQIHFSGNDKETKMIFDKMVAKAKEINSKSYDYKLPIGHVQNSNTVARILIEEAGLEFKTPLRNNKPVFIPGVGGYLDETFIDFFIKEYPKHEAKI